MLSMSMVFGMQLASGQPTRIDSLKLVLVNHEGLKKIEVLVALAREYHLIGDYESALNYISHAQELSFYTGDSIMIVHTSRRKGHVLARIEKVDESLHELYFALPIARRLGLNSEIMYLTNLIGLNHTIKADYDKALLFLEESLVLRREMGDISEISTVLSNIGMVYYKMKFYHRALKYSEESIALKKQINDYWDYEIVLINAGMCHAYLKNYKEALVLLNEGLTFSREAGTVDLACSGYFGLGIVYLGMDDLVRAQHHFAKSLKLSVENNLTRFQAENQLYLGKIFFTKGNKREGVDQLLDAEKLASQFEYNELLITVYEELIRMFRSMGSTEHLSAYQNKYIQLKEKVYSASLTENLAKLEVKLEVQKNAIILRQQQETLRLNDKLVDNQRAIIISCVGIGILLSVLLYIIYQGYQMSKGLNAELEMKVALRTKELMENVRRLQELHKLQSSRLINVQAVMLSHTLTLKGLHSILPEDLTENQSIELNLNRLQVAISND